MQLGKYDSDRDAVLNMLTVSGWANQSTGDVEAPTGFVALVIVHPVELSEIEEAFSADVENEIEEGFSWDSIIGNFLLSENSQGFVTVTEFPTCHDAKKEYERISRAYGEWLGEDD